MNKLLVTAAALAAGFASPALAQSITNGSFEQPTRTPGNGQFDTYFGGSTAITGWTVTGNSVDRVFSTLWAGATGDWSVDLSGNGAGGLYQDVGGLTVGQTYRVNFQLGGNFYGEPRPTKALTVAAGTFSSGYTLTSASTGFSGYTPFSFVFTAGNITERLSFTSGNDTAYGPVLDAVSLSAVPEPASWALMIGGFVLVGFAMRRRKANVAFA